jgi:hypothetical protein
LYKKYDISRLKPLDKAKVAARVGLSLPITYKEEENTAEKE